MLSGSVIRYASLLLRPQRSMNHIKNFREETIRVQAQRMQNAPVVQSTSRVYKPTYTIQFNREGEVLLYSADVLTRDTIYFRYPYTLYEIFMPLAALNFVLDPFALAWYYNSFLLAWHLHGLKYTPNKLFLLRGGKVIKVESRNFGNYQHVFWLENWMAKPLTEDKMHFDDRDNADFLDEVGQLKYDLNVEYEEVRLWGITNNDQQIYLKKYGTVHHPELLEAAMKGYNIDTTDFVINTADNIRFREGSFGQ